MPKEQNIDDLRVLIEGAGDPFNVIHAHRHRAQARGSGARRTRTANARSAKKGKQLDPRSLIAAEYVMLATTLRENAYPASEIIALYRLRWQIELAFKRLKNLLRMTAYRRKPTRADETGFTRI